VTAAPVVLKYGGELVEDPAHLRTAVSSIVAAIDRSIPLVVVHGGGREVDMALKASGIEKRQVDGLRITDEATLGVVVSVLAGVVNTRVVAALVTSGVPAVGLTGVDGGCGLSRRAAAHHTVDGRTVDLGYVGVPVDHADTAALQALIDRRFVPVVASIGVDGEGRLLNVNADTFAGHLAARLRARRLVIAGTTAGVLSEDGATIPVLEASAIGSLFTSGTANAGMIAKLRACEHAIAGGVHDAVIVDGRDAAEIESAVSGSVPRRATRVMAAVALSPRP
jgi:acetylglutamate kinase